MWVRTQKTDELIELTGGKFFKEDGEIFSICFTRTSEFDTYEILAEYHKKQIRDFVFEMFETSIIDGQTAFSFQDGIVTKMALELEKKDEGKSMTETEKKIMEFLEVMLDNAIKDFAQKSFSDIDYFTGLSKGYRNAVSEIIDGIEEIINDKSTNDKCNDCVTKSI